MDKPALRQRCWRALREAGAARFPGVEGRIPNFVGAERAAERLAALPEWVAARAIKANPDSPHRPARHHALKAGKVVFMAVPKLAAARPFLRLDPQVIGAADLWRASSARGAAELGVAVAADDLPTIDLVLTGCVGVSRDGARLGKGGGYSDLEYAMLAELGCVGPETPVVTTVHPSQILPDGAIPMEPHDVAFDRVVTPDEVVHCARSLPRPTGIDRARLSAEQIQSIPFLQERFA